MTVMYYENNDKSDIVSFSQWRANNIIQSIIEACMQFNCTIDYSTIRLVDLNHSDDNKYSDIKDCNYKVYFIDPTIDREMLLCEIKGLQTYFSICEIRRNLSFDIESIIKTRKSKGFAIEVNCQGFLLKVFFYAFFPSNYKDFTTIIIETDIKNNISIIGSTRFKEAYTNFRSINIKNYEIPLHDLMLVFNLEHAIKDNNELLKLIPEVSVVSAYDFNSVDFNNRLAIAQMMIS